MVQCSTLCALYIHYSYCGDVLTRFPSYEPIEVVLDTILMHLKLYVSDFLFMTTDISAEHIESREVTNHHELSTKSNSCSRLLNMFRFFLFRFEIVARFPLLATSESTFQRNTDHFIRIPHVIPIFI